MNYLLDNYLDESSLEQKAIREGFGEGIVHAADLNDQIVVLNADLPGSLKLQKFSEKYPKNYFQVGVAEQNMAGIGTGLAHYGKIPFITSFAAFSPGLNFSQIRLAALGHQNLKVVGSHYGLNVGPDGSSAQMNADIGMMKSLAGMTIVSPADYHQAIQATIELSKLEGPAYLRVTRAKLPVFIKHGSDFEIGKAQVLEEGDDLTIIASGSIVYEALHAAELVKKEKGITIDFINLHTIKPLDTETIFASAKKTGKVVVIEEHNVWGGVGESITRFLGEVQPTPVKCIGLQDTFGESGEHKELWEKYGLSRDKLVEQISEFIG
ncbi:transketolase family protein [Candidatus Dojkabacteria bacterium]|uniref:Transketolase family protein n=1 Tax=Candidatus Dojkabacteria bacterium TaxID=2099670 RepID=A0A955L8Z9_9BACT|nr:transketolase family protein [Candidatus Dojkabacteria bacterium]